MGFEKSKLKLLVVNDIGATIEDRLEGEIKAAHELAGASIALKQAAERVPPMLVSKVDEDASIVDGLEAILVRQMIKKYLTRVGDFLKHLSDVEQQKAVAQGGRVDGIRQAMFLVQKTRTAEEANLQRILDVARVEEEGQPVRTQAEAARLEHGTAAERKAAEQAQEEKPKPKKKRASKKKPKAG